MKTMTSKEFMLFWSGGELNDNNDSVYEEVLETAKANGWIEDPIDYLAEARALQNTPLKELIPGRTDLLYTNGVAKGIMMATNKYELAVKVLKEKIRALEEEI